MGLWQKTLQRIQRRLPKMDFANKKHEDCTNFDNGICINAPRFLNLTNLKPKGQACPHFKAIKIEKNKPKDKKNIGLNN
ncbi:hypothetical protein JJE00_05475 [Candidatus Bathyarchaeota archaeon]|nr:hypothetical protein [Candidatus Bathyarchaeota archaeon]